MNTSTEETQEHEAPRHAAVQTFLGFWVVVAIGTSFAVVLGLVAARWTPLLTWDAAIVEEANQTVSGAGWVVAVLHFITNLGGSEAAWFILSVLTVWLLVRRLPRLAGFVAATGLGAAVLSPGIKAIVARARPVVDVVVATAPGGSFPSGHALGSTVAYGVVLLVFLPVVPRRFRRAAVVAVVTLVGAIGVTRVALGVHYVSDVLGGWMLGVLWLGVTTSAFRSSRVPDSEAAVPLTDQGAAALDAREPAPAHDRPLPDGWRTVAVLLVAGVLLWGALVGIGLLITDLSAVRQLDAAIVTWFASIRTNTLTTVAVAVGHLGGTAGITIFVLIAAPLLLAATRRWGPPLFLAAAVVGETVLFLATVTIVSRSRPAVEHISATLPPTSSFPSGHAAAAAAAYGAVAVLAWAWTRGWLRVSIITLATVAAVGVALSRIYRGVHHPTDTVVSIVYAAVWVAVCWWALRPDPPDGGADDDACGAPRGRVRGSQTVAQTPD